MAVLGYLSKLEVGLGLDFGDPFMQDFSIKKSLFNTLSMDKDLISYFFFFPKITNKMLLSSYLDS